ncbi:site-specific integrase [Paraburkholderia sp. SUR17]|uniref:tyrosine-type recombinase/integrase n=1 Tax=Paraburkholderia sp. SUR17 TaxID=3034358 RepID=UPI00240787CD|nr:site-specific integrase [Paraburkholderia sp. SUR17]WEY37775.1 integrase arm-type DNA-binding domain-containing protein [Paraburkholderia sp. SUR17]
MSRPIKRLSAVKVRQEKAQGYYADGGGLYLQVSKTGTKSWIFRYSRSGVLTTNGKRKHTDIGLGSYLSVSLEAAREKADGIRRAIANGEDPLAMRQSERAKIASKMTFTDCAAAYIEAHKHGWKNDKHVGQWTNTLTTYANPFIGKKDISLVDTHDVMRVLEPIWTTKNETASRVRGRLEKVLAWATTRGLRSGENPARWKGHLDTLLAKPSAVQKEEHHAALPYSEIGGFMESLRAMDGVASRALEFGILNASRTSEIIGAQWTEIDLDAKLWTIPAERMKMKKEHRVPLSKRAVTILKEMELARHGNFVFPGMRDGSGLSNMSLLAVLKRMGRADLTVHGFRSTFRDWAAECTNFPRELAEKALAHAVRSEVEAAYQRGDLLTKRGRMMDAWATYCSRKREAGTIAPLQRQA